MHEGKAKNFKPNDVNYFNDRNITEVHDIEINHRVIINYKLLTANRPIAILISLSAHFTLCNY